VAEHHHGFAQGWMTPQGRFYFTQINSDSAKLNLAVNTPDKINCAVRSIPANIARSVQPSARLI
jgi:hypothetical protein